MDRNSTTKALSLWEILHPILINLDMRTLLHAQRVCRLWHHITTKSRSLQKALFFLPVEERQATASDERRSQINPLFREILWPQLSWLATCGRKLKYSERKRQAKTRRIPILRSENASWRRMLIRQPPPITIGIKGEDENFSPAPIIYYDEDISTDTLWALTNISFFADHCFTRCIFSGDNSWKESCPQEAELISDQDLKKCDILVMGHWPPNYLLRMMQWILRYETHYTGLSLRTDIHPPLLDFYYLFKRDRSLMAHDWTFVIANHNGPVWTYNVDDMARDGESTLAGDTYRTQLNPLTEEEATVVKQIVNHESLPRGVIPAANYLNRFLRVMAKLFEKGILPKVVFEEHRIIYGVR
ncbi:hypothetical protein ANOM_009216 [Aspergillus nomiae NRRL 13137]|uniref:F-box domain-containing protein n=1 Tax=Aspergillus nomiae NRRL (strain ATCC 15546 / NRRL 13137 / CBS 260.88 / M93) TaxID=1509407 RepID=A0A0L1IRA6_ASPN3|nr:uncharacterized protein ANOM_009216 [Aspergillus nomiae NRRL 13137]KNG82004.1 hypothetical protein ANOM_009216 [Aspergillus nomiae NRRL 13137]